MKFKIVALLLVAATTTLSFDRLIVAGHYSEWSDPVNAESVSGASVTLNTPSGDGCPIESPDGLSLYMATNRPGGFGGQDIWVARRSAVGDPWGAPENLGEPVNTAADDFCPTPVRGKGLFFVSSNRVDANGSTGCGGNDIFFTREKKDGWEEPVNLGCGINSPAAEWSPSLFEDNNGNSVLYFASTRTDGFASGGSDADIYYSVNFDTAQLAPGLNTEYNDFRPNVHRTGREIVFDSDRPGNLGPAGTYDIWTASRETTSDIWTEVTHLPPPINSAASETRATLSWDGLRLYFGSTDTTRPGANGGNDIYFATRQKLNGNQR